MTADDAADAARGDDASPWWHRAFVAAYREVYAHRDDAAAEAEIAALAPRLAGVRGPILDAGCGDGRHVAALRRRGLCAFGADFSVDLLGCAGGRSEVANRVVRADLNRPPFADRAFGAVLSLFTAFGYGDDDENAAQLARLVALLAAGGTLVLDLPDRERLRATLVPESRRRTSRGWVVHERRAFDGRHVEKWVRVLDGGCIRAQWRERVRLYGRDEIAALATGAGAPPEERWPGLRGPHVDEGRIVLWCRRPTRGGDAQDVTG